MTKANIDNDEEEIVSSFKEAKNWLAIRGKSEFSGIENAAFNYFNKELEEIKQVKNTLKQNIRKYENMLKTAMKDGVLSSDENTLLRIRREELKVTESQHNSLVKKYSKKPDKNKPVKKQKNVNKKKESRKKERNKKNKKHNKGDEEQILKAIKDFYGLNYEEFIIARAVDGMPHEAANAIIDQMVEEKIIKPVNQDRPQEIIELTSKWQEIYSNHKNDNKMRNILKVTGDASNADKEEVKK